MERATLESIRRRMCCERIVFDGKSDTITAWQDGRCVIISRAEAIGTASYLGWRNALSFANGEPR